MQPPCEASLQSLSANRCLTDKLDSEAPQRDSSAIFPQELLDKIIDLLADDKECLKQCALAHHSMLERSRKHIHHSFELKAWDTQLQKSLYSSPETAKHVKDLVVTLLPVPMVAKLVSDITSHLNLPSIASRIVLRLTNVTKLSIRYNSLWNTLSLEDRDLFATSFSKVTKLTLFNFAIHDVHEFILFLSAFPSLTHLTLEDLGLLRLVADPSTRCDLPDQGVPGKQLRYLMLSKVASGSWDSPQVKEVASHWLVHLAPFLQHERFKLVWCLGDQTLDALKDTLIALRGSLTHLKLYSRNYLDVLMFGSLGLGQCTRLRSLSLVSESDPGRDYDDNVAHFSWVSSCLKELISARVQLHTFKISLLESYTDVPPADFADRLCKLDSLCEVIVVLREQRNGGQGKGYLLGGNWHRLLRLRRKGVHVKLYRGSYDETSLVDCTPTEN